MSIDHLILPSPAKLNLFLYITGRRPDGYHDLQTLFLMLDHGDQLEFRRIPGEEIVLEPEIPGVPLEDNLIYRAVMKLKPHRKVSGGLWIGLRKVLPMGGGLGGGSSNAATALVAANRLWDCGLDEDALAELGCGLGADVPVFVRGRTAFAEGVGERLVPVTVPGKWYLVVVPHAHVSTREVFCHPDLIRNTPRRSWEQLRDLGWNNDFEPLVRRLCPEVDSAMNWLDRYGKAHLTGTGACVFAEFASAEEAQAAFRALPPSWSGFVARGLMSSPLQEELARQAG